MIGDNLSSTASMRTLKYFLGYSPKHKARVHQLDFFGAFPQANIKHRVLWIWTADVENTSHNIATIWNIINNEEFNVLHDQLWKPICWLDNQFTDGCIRIITITMLNFHIMQVCTRRIQTICIILCWFICVFNMYE